MTQHSYNLVAVTALFIAWSGHVSVSSNVDPWPFGLFFFFLF